MKNIFLFLLLVIVIVIISHKKEGLQNISQPITMDDPMISSMVSLSLDTSANVMNDLKYFNNATNIIYGYTKIPNV